MTQSSPENDNLRHEYVALFAQVSPDIPWARIALQRPPEAVNLWVGNSRSVTALHRDNYENIYVQVLGRKHFTLLPPVCQPCVSETSLPAATFARVDGSELALRQDDGGDEVPFPLWDPDLPEEKATPYSALARPTRVTLEPGDMLYLPALW
jgi:peptidyl-lysine (3S)-dioxygenase / protease